MYADESLKKDKEVVLAAIAQDGSALEYADESLWEDEELLAAGGYLGGGGTSDISEEE